MWSYDNIILDSDIHVITDMEGKQVNRPGQIIFGDHVWLGSRCTVLKNTTLCSNIIIGSSSVVTKSLEEPYCVYAGSVATKKKSGVQMEKGFCNRQWSNP